MDLTHYLANLVFIYKLLLWLYSHEIRSQKSQGRHSRSKYLHWDIELWEHFILRSITMLTFTSHHQRFLTDEKPESLRANYTIQYFFLNSSFVRLNSPHVKALSRFILRSYCTLCFVFLVHVTLKPSWKSSKSSQLASHHPKTELLLHDIFPFKSFDMAVWHDAGSIFVQSGFLCPLSSLLLLF